VVEQFALKYYREKNGMFKILWLSAAGILAVGWIAYGIWRIIDNIQEKKRPKPTTKHLTDVKKSFEDYTRKLGEFEKPTYEREDKKPGK
jgi:hypothetical protein